MKYLFKNINRHLRGRIRKTRKALKVYRFFSISWSSHLTFCKDQKHKISISEVDKWSAVRSNNANCIRFKDFLPPDPNLSEKPLRCFNALSKRTRRVLEEAIDGTDYSGYDSYDQNKTIAIYGNNNMSTSYVRAINDYTFSAHEKYFHFFNELPSSSTITTVTDIHFSSLDEIAARLIHDLLEIGYQKLDDANVQLIEENEDDYDSHCVYRQRVMVFQNPQDGGKKASIELLGSMENITLATLSDDADIGNKVYAMLMSIKDQYKRSKEKKEKTFYTISASQNGFELEDLKIKTNYDPQLIIDNYNDDFVEVNQVIMDAIDSEKRGLVLLHGLPGSGKTSYIKQLITKGGTRKIVYVPTHLTSSIASPNFISFVKEQLSNSVLVLEDAESVLLSRESGESHKEAVSNILNMTDGILAEALNILIICTFNTDMKYIDQALLRKGRLLLNYEFGKLTTAKASSLAQRLYGKIVDKPMTIADVYNLDYDLISPKEPEKISFGFAPK